jgi:hypothetical protein
MTHARTIGRAKLAGALPLIQLAQAGCGGKRCLVDLLSLRPAPITRTATTGPASETRKIGATGLRHLGARMATVFTTSPPILLVRLAGTIVTEDAADHWAERPHVAANAQKLPLARMR